MKYCLLSATLALASTLGLTQETNTIRLSGPPVTVEFAQSSNRLALVQIEPRDGLPLLFRDDQWRQPGAADGPLAITPLCDAVEWAIFRYRLCAATEGRA